MLKTVYTAKVNKTVDKKYSIQIKMIDIQES